MAVEDADSVGVQGLQLVVNDAILTWSIRLVLDTLDPLLDTVPLQVRSR